MFISIITPVFNRADLIPILYNSLIRQGSYEFEWIVVDDGSIDNIKKIIQNLQNEAPFSIKFISKVNGGKHTALNVGIENSSGSWIFIVDSDDYLSDDAINIIQKDLRKTYDINCAGLIYLKAFSSNKTVIGTGFLKDQVYNEELAGSIGDKAMVFKSAVLKSHLFPVYDEENFITEAYVWNSILQDSYLLFQDNVIYFAEYLEGGLTHGYQNLLKNNEKGTLDFVLKNLQLRRKGLNIYKQTVYHFMPICHFKNLRLLKLKTSLSTFAIFLILIALSKIKKLIKGLKLR